MTTDTDKLAADIDMEIAKKALELLWFFIPDIEPCHVSNKSTCKIRNRKWHEACALYQEHYFRLESALTQPLIKKDKPE